MTGPDGTILERTLLGDRLLITPDQRGTAVDSQREEPEAWSIISGTHGIWLDCIRRRFFQWNGHTNTEPAMDTGMTLIALTVNASLTLLLAWDCWSSSTEDLPEQIMNEQVLIELNADLSVKGMSAQEIVSVVQAWQSGALSRDSMLDLLRRREILPERRTNEEETKLIDAKKSH